jgi:hypothetical protein
MLKQSALAYSVVTMIKKFRIECNAAYSYVYLRMVEIKVTRKVTHKKEQGSSLYKVT